MEKLKRVLNIYFSPAEVFSKLKEKQDWLFPLVLVLIVSLFSSYLLLPSVILPSQVEQITSNSNLSLEQKNELMTRMTGIYPYITTTIGSVVGIIVSTLFMACIIIVIRFIFGGKKVGFKHVFSAVAYIGVINILATIFISLIMYTTGDTTTGLNLGLFIDMRNYFGRVLSGIGFFGIWQTILYGILLMVFYKYSKVKAFSIMFSLYLIWRLLISLFHFPGLT